MILLISALLPLPGLSLSDQIFQPGIWIYLLVFLLITFTSTIVGGAIPDNMFLILTGAAAATNGLSFAGLVIVDCLRGICRVRDKLLEWQGSWSHDLQTGLPWCAER